MAKPSQIIFDDIFEVLAADPGGKHFDKGRKWHLQWLPVALLLAEHTSSLIVSFLCSHTLPMPQRSVRDGPHAGHQHQHLPTACGSPSHSLKFGYSSCGLWTQHTLSGYHAHFRGAMAIGGFIACAP